MLSGSCGWRGVAGAAVLVAGSAVGIYVVARVPVPDHSSNPVRLRMFMLKLQINNILQSVRKALSWKDRDVQYLALVRKLRGSKYQAKPDRVEGALQIRDAVFDGVPVRIFRPVASDGPTPAVVYLHGGGWILESVETYNTWLTLMATELRMTVVGVEYRLAPEHPFPVPFEDCLNATKHLIRNAAEFQVDPSRIALMGDSAGGNLAAAVALKLAHISFKSQPKLQVLLYPGLQAVDFKLPSYTINSQDPYLPSINAVTANLAHAQGSVKNEKFALENQHVTLEARESMKEVLYSKPFDKLLDNTMKRFPEGSSAVWDELKEVLTNPYFSPLMANDLTDLPQTFMYTCEQDVFRDDGFLYVRRLQQAGNNVTHLHDGRAFHGLLILNAQLNLNVADANRARQQIWEFVKRSI